MAYTARLYMVLIVAGLHIGYLKGLDVDGYTDWGEKVGLELQTKDTERYYTTEGSSKLSDAPLSQQPPAQTAGLNEAAPYGNYVENSAVGDPRYLNPAQNYYENKDPAAEPLPEHISGSQPSVPSSNLPPGQYLPPTEYSDPYKHLSSQYQQGADVQALPQPREELARIQLPPNTYSEYVKNQEGTRVDNQPYDSNIQQYPPSVYGQQPAILQPPSVVNVESVPQPINGVNAELEHRTDQRGQELDARYQGVQPSSQQGQYQGSLIPQNRYPVQQEYDPTIEGRQQVNPQNTYQAAPGYPTVREHIPPVPLNTETEYAINNVNAQLPVRPVEVPVQGSPVYSHYPQVIIPENLQTQDTGINQLGGISEAQSQLPEHIYPQNLFPGGNGLFPPNMAEIPTEQAPTIPETARTMDSPASSAESTPNDTAITESFPQFDPMTGTQNRTLDKEYPDNQDTGALADSTQYIPQEMVPSNQAYDAYGRPIPPSQPETPSQPIPERPYPLTGSNVQNAEYGLESQQQPMAPEQYPNPSPNKYIYPEQMGFSQNETGPLLTGGSYANSQVQEDQQGTANEGYQYQSSPYGQEQQQPVQGQPDLYRPLTQGQDLPNPVLPQQSEGLTNINQQPTSLQGQPLPPAFVNEPVADLTQQGMPAIDRTAPEFLAPQGVPVYTDDKNLKQLDLSTVVDTTTKDGTTAEPELDDEMTQWLKDFGDDESDAGDYNGDDAEYSEDEGYKYSDEDEDDEYDDQYSDEEDDVADKDMGAGQEMPAFEDQDHDVFTADVDQSSSSTLQAPSTTLPQDKPVVHGNSVNDDMPSTDQAPQNMWPTQTGDYKPYPGQPMAPPSSDNLPSTGQLIAPSTGNNLPFPQEPFPPSLQNQQPYPIQQIGGDYIHSPEQPGQVSGGNKMPYPYPQFALSDNSWPYQESLPKYSGNRMPHTEQKMAPSKTYYSPYLPNNGMPSSNIPYSETGIPQYGDKLYPEYMKLTNEQKSEEVQPPSGTGIAQDLEETFPPYTGDSEPYPGQPLGQYEQNLESKYPEYIDEHNTQHLEPLVLSDQENIQEPFVPYSGNTYSAQAMPQYGTNQLPSSEQSMQTFDNTILKPFAPILDDSSHYSKETVPYEVDQETYSKQDNPTYGDLQVPYSYENEVANTGQYIPIPVANNIQFPEKSLAQLSDNFLQYPEQAVLQSSSSLEPVQPMPPSGYNYQPYKDKVMVPVLSGGDQTYSEQNPIISSSIPYPDQPVLPSNEQNIQYPGEAIWSGAEETKQSLDQPIANSGDLVFPGKLESIPYPGQPVLPVGEDMEQPVGSIPYPGQPGSIPYFNPAVLPLNQQNVQYPGETILAGAEETKQSLGQPIANSGDITYPGKLENIPYPGQPVLPVGEDMEQPVGSIPYPGQPGSIQYPNSAVLPSNEGNIQYTGEAILPGAEETEQSLGQSITNSGDIAYPVKLDSIPYPGQTILPVGSIPYPEQPGSIQYPGNPMIPNVDDDLLSALQPALMPSVTTEVHSTVVSPTGVISNTPVLPTDSVDTLGYDMASSSIPEASSSDIGINPTMITENSDGVAMTEQVKLPEIHPIDTNLFKIPESVSPEKQQELIQQQQMLLQQQTEQIALQQEAQQLIDDQNSDHLNLTSSEHHAAATTEQEQEAEGVTSEVSTEAVGSTITDITTASTQPTSEGAGALSSEKAQTEPALESGIKLPDLDHSNDDEEEDVEDKDEGGVTTTLATDESTEPTSFPSATDAPAGEDMMDMLEGPDPDYEGPPSIPSKSGSLEEQLYDTADDEKQSTKETPPPSVKMADMQKEALRYTEPDQPGAGHFMAYFVTCIVFVILGYLFYHNRKKVMGVLVEGRNGKAGRRGRNGNYKQLAVTVEEALPTDEKSGKDFIY